MFVQNLCGGARWSEITACITSCFGLLLIVMCTTSGHATLASAVHSVTVRVPHTTPALPCMEKYMDAMLV